MKSWFRNLLSGLVVGLVVFIAAMSVHSQGAGAEVSGLVTDNSGASLPGVTITVTNVATGVTRVLTSGSDGRYDFVDLPTGEYTLRFELGGFVTAQIDGIVLNIGTVVEHDMQMKLGAVQQQVTVQAEAGAVDVNESQVAGVITETQINTLPINTRQYLNLALLQPGTTQDGSRPYYNNVQIGAGSTYYDNGFFSDGVRNTWAEQGEPRQDFPQGAVAEFKVYTTNFPANLGLAEGGFVEVVTKSGTNQLHGDIFEYWRNERLNALNKFQKLEESTAGITNFPFNRNQFGADLGGPIIKNRMHFFLSFERTQTRDSFTVYTGLPQFYSSVEGTFPNPSWRDLWLARWDGKINEKQTVFVRYAGEREFQGCYGCGGNDAANAGFDQKIPRDSVVFGHTYVISPNIVNDFRLQYAYAAFELGIPGEPVWDQFGIYSPARLDGFVTQYHFPSLTYGESPQGFGIEHRYEMNEDFTWIRGNHQFHFGTEYDRIPFKEDSPSNEDGSFTFSKDQVFNPNNPAILAGLTKPTLFTATFPPIVDGLPTDYWGWYVSDDWRVLPRLSVNIGLRYDRQFGSFNENFNPATLPKALPYACYTCRGDDNNIAPRIGLDWDVTGSGKWLARGGFGIYYGNVRTLPNMDAEPRDLVQCSISITNPSYPNPYGNLSPTAFCSQTPPNVTELANNFQNPYSEQFNAGLTRQLTSTMSLSVDGVYAHGLHDYRVVDVNFNPANASVRPLPQWGQINVMESTSQSKYKALYVRFTQNYSHHFQYLVSYTLSNCTDNNPAAHEVSATDPNLDWGPCTIDRRNALVASGSFLLPWKITVGAIWTVRSALPFSALSSTVIDGQTQYVPGTSRDQGERNLNLAAVNAYRATLNLAPIPASQINSSRYNDVDIRVSKALFVREQRELELAVQVFNVFDTVNLLAPATSVQVTSAASNSFGEILSAQPGSQAELSARFTF